MHVNIFPLQKILVPMYRRAIVADPRFGHTKQKKLCF